MGFLIYGQDSADFDDGPHDLHEEHQSYMDKWMPRFVARGPTLSEDESRHTGSVHVLDTADAEIAKGFAFDEPYARAGWYADITVVPFQSLVQGTMWDRPKPAGDLESSFALVSWAPSPSTADLIDSIRSSVAYDEGPPWLFLGLLMSDDSAQITGLAGGVDLSGPATEALFQGKLAALPLKHPDLVVRRWARGGRSDD